MFFIDDSFNCEAKIKKMIKVLLAIKKNFAGIMLFSVILFPMMFLLNVGFSLYPYWKIIQAFVFTIMCTVIFCWPQSKVTFFILSLFLIILMAVFYFVGLMEYAEIVGSTGVGFVIINIISYLPQLIRLGYINRW